HALVVQLKNDNELDALFRLLFLKQCNALHEILPGLFERTADYLELLLPLSFTDRDGVVYHLVNDIPEADFDVSQGGQIEIIGWLYQFYNSERRHEVIDLFNQSVVKKNDIPAATQLFTTDWVVKYMVDNSLGRYWIERNPNSRLADKLDFLVLSKTDQIKYIDDPVRPQELTFFDPCMGSGHILIYAFDVLMYIYEESGYTKGEAALLIVENNLFGLDIDKRAYQLAYFALMMKARSYNRRALNKSLNCNLSYIEESNTISSLDLSGLDKDHRAFEIAQYLVETFINAKETGSIIKVEPYDYEQFIEQLTGHSVPNGQLDLMSIEFETKTIPILKQLAIQAKILSNIYTVVCTNPPYLNKFDSYLKKYTNLHYKKYAKDLFSIFIYRNFDFCKLGGYSGFMTPFVWMFIKSYEPLRTYIIENKNITTLIQLEYSAFEEATVPVCTFVLQNCKTEKSGLYIRLSDFKGGMRVQKDKVLEAINDNDCLYFYEADEEQFAKIPGSPIAYWASEQLVNAFSKLSKIHEICDLKQGLITGKNDRFLRKWYEISEDKLNKKWFIYHKGGNFRKWYGNNDLVVNWENDGYEIRTFVDPKSRKLRSRPQNINYYFREGLTWTTLTTGCFSARYMQPNHIFDAKGSSIFVNEQENLKQILAYINSIVSQKILEIITPTIDYSAGSIGNIPIDLNIFENKEINHIVSSNIALSRTDWDSFETSWDFQGHPLVRPVATIAEAFRQWQDECEDRFTQLKANEEELNRIFIDIYGLENELTPEVDDKDVTVARVYDTPKDIPDTMKGNQYVRTKEEDIKSFISYAVGCLFGRYSLDMDGLAYAGGDWDESKYQTFMPSSDNCILITEETYFEDDIVARFIDFVRVIYGSDTLEENLDFIADALGRKGNSSREIIRRYFLKDFYKDHVKTYQKRPIYWLFDSGRQEGFKALVYIHRWNADVIGNVRVNYLHRVQRIYDNELERLDDIIANSEHNRDKRYAEKKKNKLIKQIKETREYDEKIAHLANERIDIDLDDGVKVNHVKVQTSVEGKNMKILANI
ncbi:MAG: BREX-1 system adenine-specific DNA-methyltransferase PglX, partial [Clostridiaceae bacterium]|nr:BREX-1 system adenine-specific DNA-methyltransferase PglX [Clostridiaceae bacterium]